MTERTLDPVTHEWIYTSARHTLAKHQEYKTLVLTSSLLASIHVVVVCLTSMMLTLEGTFPLRNIRLAKPKVCSIWPYDLYVVTDHVTDHVTVTMSSRGLCFTYRQQCLMLPGLE